MWLICHWQDQDQWQTDLLDLMVYPAPLEDINKVLSNLFSNNLYQEEARFLLALNSYEGMPPFLRIFKSKSSSITFSDSMSTSSNVSCQSNKSTEEFWNQYRRNQPKLSFTLRTKQIQTQIKPVNSIHEKSPPPPPTQNTISL